MSFVDEAEGKKYEAAALKWVKVRVKSDDPHSMLTCDEVINDHGVPHKIFLQYLTKEVEENAACCSLPFTLLLVVSYAMVALTHDDARYIRSVENSLDHDILENANFAFTGLYVGHKGMDDVNSVADFWSFMVNGLVPLVFIQERLWHEGADLSPNSWYSNNSMIPTNARGLWLQFNRIVGGVRLRQEVAESQRCSPPDILWPAYDLDCDQGWGYELDPEIRSARFTANPQKETWLYVDETLADLQNSVWTLEKDRWLNRKTKKVEISIPVYNGELGLHCMMYVNFFFSRGGHIWKKLMPLSFTASLHPYWYFWIGDAVWAFCVLYIFLAETKEVYGVVTRGGCGALRSEYLSFWNAFDWISIMCALTIMGMFFFAMTKAGSLNESLSKLDNTLSFNSTDYRDGVHKHIVVLEDTVQYIYNFRLVMAAYPLIIILRLFKAYSAQPRLAMVTHTLGSASRELMEFGLVFFSVLITFVISGVILFGREVMSFGTFPRAFFACFRMIVGDLLWDENMVVGRVLALGFTFLFMLVIVCLLLNMLLAIIMKHYVEAKNQAGEAQTLWAEAYEVFMRWKMERQHLRVPIATIVAALEKASSSFEEMEDYKSDMYNELEEQILDELGKPLKVIDVQRAFADYKDTAEDELPAEQVEELMAECVDEWYSANNTNIDMDEVLNLTHKVDHRTRKISILARKLETENPCPNEVQAMEDFLKQLEISTEEMQHWQESQRKQIDELRRIKRGLLLTLKVRQSSVDQDQLDPDDPTSVNSLLSHGEHTKYRWQLPISKRRPPDNSKNGIRSIHDSPEQEEPQGGGRSGPFISGYHSRQPRAAFDEESDEEDD